MTQTVAISKLSALVSKLPAACPFYGMATYYLDNLRRDNVTHSYNSLTGVLHDLWAMRDLPELRDLAAFINDTADGIDGWELWGQEPCEQHGLELTAIIEPMLSLCEAWLLHREATRQRTTRERRATTRAMQRKANRSGRPIGQRVEIIAIMTNEVWATY